MRMPSTTGPLEGRSGRVIPPPGKPLLIRIYLQDSLSIYCIYIYVLYIEIHLQTYLYCV